MFLARIARTKYRLSRMSSIVGLSNSIILIAGFGWHWWYIFLLIMIVAIYIFEQMWGISGEQEVTWGANKEWQTFKKDFYELKSRLDNEKWKII